MGWACMPWVRAWPAGLSHPFHSVPLSFAYALQAWTILHQSMHGVNITLASVHAAFSFSPVLHTPGLLHVQGRPSQAWVPQKTSLASYTCMPGDQGLGVDMHGKSQTAGRAPTPARY